MVLTFDGLFKSCQKIQMASLCSKYQNMLETVLLNKLIYYSVNILGGLESWFLSKLKLLKLETTSKMSESTTSSKTSISADDEFATPEVIIVDGSAKFRDGKRVIFNFTILISNAFQLQFDAMGSWL